MRLVLASASPRRAELLRAAGFEFEVRPADVDERKNAAEDAARYVRRLAGEKSAQVLGAMLDAAGSAGAELAVLGADTVVVVDGEILGKPEDESDARRMLCRLAGRTHEVMTGVSLRSPASELTALETTTVWFRSLEQAELDWYISTGEGSDKAGAYGIQGRASRFITRLDGSYSNVVGLPVATVHRLVSQLNGRGCIR
jgi:septum formation protein